VSEGCLNPLEAIAVRGFAILSSLVALELLAPLRRAYDRAFAEARPEDLRVRESIRLGGLVNYGSEFEAACLTRELLDLAVRVVGEAVQLRFLNARTLLPGAPAQDLHVDRWRPDLRLAGFIVPIDDFRADNGATRFVPGSHLRDERGAAEVLALAPAGSCIVYDGSVLHGYGANRSSTPRRSIQGGFIARSFRDDAEGAGKLSRPPA
jgi:hypothetical protein